MRPSQRTHPDDPFTPGRVMRLRVTAARVWWRHPRASRAVTVLLAGAAVTVLLIAGSRHLAHCVTIPVRSGGGIRTCR